MYNYSIAMYTVCLCIAMYNYSIAMYDYSIAMYNYSIAMYNYSIAMYNYIIAMYNYSIAMYNYSIAMYNYSIAMYNYIIAMYNYIIAMYNYSIAMYNYIIAMYNYIIAMYNYIIAMYNYSIAMYNYIIAMYNYTEYSYMYNYSIAMYNYSITMYNYIIATSPLAQKQLTVLNRMLEDSNTRQLESSENFTVLLSELQERIRTFEGIHTDQSSQSTKAQPVDVEVQTDVNSVNMTMVISAFIKIIWYFIMPRNSNTSILALAILLLSFALYVNYNSPTTTNYSLPTVQEFHEKVVLYELIDQSALPWPSKLYYWSNTATIVAPVVVKFSNFSMQKNSVLHSNTFFGFTNGYLLRLRIYPSGSPGIVSKHLYMSVYLDYMRGPHDDKLDKLGYFPINKSFTIELLNPNDDNSHLQKEITGCNITRVTGNDNNTNYVGCGFANFVSLEGYDFKQKCTCDKANVTICCYLTDDDTIYFRIQEEPPHPTAPVISKLTKFSQWLRSKKQWDNGPFFAFNGGYQMCLKVNAAGYGDGEGTHVSAYLYLMKGSHDDELEQSGHWPLRGTFTIELLNQLNDRDHHSVIVQFYHHRCSRCTNRVLGGVIANIGRGQPQFISHDSLFDLANSGYYHDDSLIFRISYEDTELPDQVAPVTFKLNKFSQWVNSKQVWLSNAFLLLKEDIKCF